MPRTLSDYAWVIEILYELLEEDKISAREWLNLVDDMPYFNRCESGESEVDCGQDIIF